VDNILSTLVSVLTALAGVTAIFGDTYDEKKELPKTMWWPTRLWVRLTPIGRVLLATSMLLCVISIALDVRENKAASDKDEQYQRFQSNSLYGIHVAVTNVERITTRFETFSLTANYQLSRTRMNGKWLDPYLKVLREEFRRAPNGSNWGFSLFQAETNSPDTFLSFDLAALNRLAHITNAAATNYLFALGSPSFLVELFKSTNGAQPEFFASSSVVRDGPAFTYDGKGDTMNVLWRINFPNALWYRNRHVSTVDDMTNKWIQVGFAEAPGSIFSDLQLLDATFVCDDAELALPFFSEVPDTVERKRQERRSKRVPKTVTLRNGKKQTITVAVTITNTFSEFAPSRVDPSLGTIVSAYQGKLMRASPDN
jgi:hypothetical protein